MATIVTNGVLNSVRNGSSRRRMAECIAEWVEGAALKAAGYRIDQRVGRHHRSVRQSGGLERWQASAFSRCARGTGRLFRSSLLPRSAKMIDESAQRWRCVPPLRIVQIEPRERRRELLEHRHELTASDGLARSAFVREGESRAVHRVTVAGWLLER